MKKFKVSILVSTYNWPEALESCVESIFRQTTLPDEIIIADDGSGKETEATIETLKKKSTVPIIHVWHEDEGFRRTVILNKAIAMASGDYIIQVDGDVMLSPHFISDHLELAENGFFVCGSRIKLSMETTNQVFTTHKYPSIWNLPFSFVLNSIRSRVLRHFLARRYAKRIEHLRGCNMAFWKEDLIKVNGYNEDLLKWGHEDSEIAYRLHFAGVGKKALKMGGFVYHLYHKEVSKDNEAIHLKTLYNVRNNHISWCSNGIDKYLKK